MDTRVAILGIIVDDNEKVEQLNALLHENGKFIVGRMGIPYPKKGISIISIVMDAPEDVISALSGKIGRIDGINVKVNYSKR